MLQWSNDKILTIEYMKFKNHDSDNSHIIVIRNIYTRFTSDASLFY